MSRIRGLGNGFLQILPASTYWPDPAGSTEPVNDDTELHLGTIRGYRWWTLAAPVLDAWPDDEAAAAWDPGWLQATNGSEWLPGVNTATCTSTYAAHPAEPVPADSCGCGFWAYWKPQHHDWLPGGRLPVFGAIDATGDVIIGENMLRAEKAEIAALHLPLTIGPKLPPDPWAEFRKRGGRIINYGITKPPRPEPASEAEIAEAELRGEAWCAVIGDRLRQLYPGAEVCETRDLLMASYPPDAMYGNMTGCPWCHQMGLPYGHEFTCQANPFAHRDA